VNLQIRDPRAHELAQKLAAKRNVSMTDAVIGALEAELHRENAKRPLTERLATIARELQSKAGQGGHDMSKEEIDVMWGHS
jgi:antitoxin VapB